MLLGRVCGIVAHDERLLKENLLALPGLYSVPTSHLRRIALIPLKPGRAGEQRCDIFGHDRVVYTQYILSGRGGTSIIARMRGGETRFRVQCCTRPKNEDAKPDASLHDRRPQQLAMYMAMTRLVI